MLNKKKLKHTETHKSLEDMDTEFVNSYFAFKMGLCQVYHITFNVFFHKLCAFEDMIGVEPIIFFLKTKSISF